MAYTSMQQGRMEGEGRGKILLNPLPRISTIKLWGHWLRCVYDLEESDPYSPMCISCSITYTSTSSNNSRNYLAKTVHSESSLKQTNTYYETDNRSMRRDVLSTWTLYSSNSLISSPYQQQSPRASPSLHKSSIKDQLHKPRGSDSLTSCHCAQNSFDPFEYAGTTSRISRTWHSWCQHTTSTQALVTLNGGHYSHLLLFLWHLAAVLWMPRACKFYWITQLGDQGCLGVLQLMSCQHEGNQLLLIRNLLGRIQKLWTMIDLFVCQVCLRVIFLLKQQSGWLS